MAYIKTTAKKRRAAERKRTKYLVNTGKVNRAMSRIAKAKQLASLTETRHVFSTRVRGESHVERVKMLHPTKGWRDRNLDSVLHNM